jgi:TfoX/Sxy family transcriptional regulator of competence genes
MAYDQALAERVRNTITGETGWVAKEMFGGIGFMLHGNMACGVIDDSLIVRVGPDTYEAALEEQHTRVFDMTGRPMRGWVAVDPPGLSTESDVHSWIQRGINFTMTLPAK